MRLIYGDPLSQYSIKQFIGVLSISNMVSELNHLYSWSLQRRLQVDVRPPLCVPVQAIAPQSAPLQFFAYLHFQPPQICIICLLSSRTHGIKPILIKLISFESSYLTYSSQPCFLIVNKANKMPNLSLLQFSCCSSQSTRSSWSHRQRGWQHNRPFISPSSLQSGL